MTWQEALRVMKEDQLAVTRPHWNNESLIMIEDWRVVGKEAELCNDHFLHGFPALRTPEKFIVPWFGNVSDYLAIDWQIVE